VLNDRKRVAFWINTFEYDIVWILRAYLPRQERDARWATDDGDHDSFITI